MLILRLFLILLYFSTDLTAQEIRHKLTVSGSSVVSKPADKLSLVIGVITQDQKVEPAMKSNGERMQKILAALTKVGLSAKEVQTGTFSIFPQYAPRPKDPLPDWHPAIVGYEVRNTLTVHTDKLDLAGPMIDAVAKEGANLVESISFSLLDPQEAQSEAIEHAVQQARAYAVAAAKEARISIGDILELTINSSSINKRYPSPQAFVMMAEDSTPISPGDVDVTASVTIVYEISGP